MNNIFDLYDMEDLPDEGSVGDEIRKKLDEIIRIKFKTKMDDPISVYSSLMKINNIFQDIDPQDPEHIEILECYDGLSLIDTIHKLKEIYSHPTIERYEECAHLYKIENILQNNVEK